MGRIIAVYGIIGGIVVAIGMGLSMIVVPHGGTTGMAAGYLSMLIAMSMVFVGMKQYRDTEKGGVIRFWPAFGVGIGIATVAGLFYVIAWEIYLYSTNYTFIDEYVRASLESMKASGESAADIAKFKSEMAVLTRQYSNPLFRIPLTFIEIAPIGLLVAVISATLLRKSSFMPARAA
jgi:hypothetical protein